MTLFIETWQNEQQLLGSDFTTVVKNCNKNQKRKIENHINSHINKIKSLYEIKPFLKNGVEFKLNFQK